MKRKQKRVISLIMTLLMVASLLPTNLLGGRITAMADTVKVLDLATGVGTITVSGTTTNTDSVKIHKNADSVSPTIKLANGYTTDNTVNDNYAKLTVDGGFKANDVITIAGCFNNTDDTKTAAVTFFVLDAEKENGYSVLFTTANFINGRTSSGDPVPETYTLDQDYDELYLGRTGSTATYITTLTVTRTTAGGTEETTTPAVTPEETTPAEEQTTPAVTPEETTPASGDDKVDESNGLAVSQAKAGVTYQYDFSNEFTKTEDFNDPDTYEKGLFSYDKGTGGARVQGGIYGLELHSGSKITLQVAGNSYIVVGKDNNSTCTDLAAASATGTVSPATNTTVGTEGNKHGTMADCLSVDSDGKPNGANVAVYEYTGDAGSVTLTLNDGKVYLACIAVIPVPEKEVLGEAQSFEYWIEEHVTDGKLAPQEVKFGDAALLLSGKNTDYTTDPEGIDATRLVEVEGKVWKAYQAGARISGSNKITAIPEWKTDLGTCVMFKPVAEGMFTVYFNSAKTLCVYDFDKEGNLVPVGGASYASVTPTQYSFNVMPGHTYLMASNGTDKTYFAGFTYYLNEMVDVPISFENKDVASIDALEIYLTDKDLGGDSIKISADSATTVKLKKNHRYELTTNDGGVSAKVGENTYFKATGDETKIDLYAVADETLTGKITGTPEGTVSSLKFVNMLTGREAAATITGDSYECIIKPGEYNSVVETTNGGKTYDRVSVKSGVENVNEVFVEVPDSSKAKTYGAKDIVELEKTGSVSYRTDNGGDVTAGTGATITVPVTGKANVVIETYYNAAYTVNGVEYTNTSGSTTANQADTMTVDGDFVITVTSTDTTYFRSISVASVVEFKSEISVPEDYKTLNEAFNAIAAMAGRPAGEEGRVTVNLNCDIFEQTVVTAPYVTLKGNDHTVAWYYGQGTLYYSVDPTTGLYNERLARDKYSSQEGNGNLWGGAFIVRGNNFIAEDTTFKNTYNYEVTELEKSDIAGSKLAGVDRLAEGTNAAAYICKERSNAFYIEADNIECYNCKILGSQDVLGRNGGINYDYHTYFKNCVIGGNVDYICGEFAAVFDNCELQWKTYAGDTGSNNGKIGFICAPKTSAYVFRNCTITVDDENAPGVAGYYGRTWGADSNATFINTETNGYIKTDGWTEMSSGEKASAIFREYNNTSNTQAFVTTGCNSSTLDEVAAYIDTEESTAVDTVLGGWTPVHYAYEVFITGFVLAEDGNWYVYVKNEVNTAADNTLYLYDGVWFWVEEGKLNKEKYAFVDYAGAKFLIANGQVASAQNGLTQDPGNPDDWYFVADGQIQAQAVGLVEYDGAWFYVQDGKLDTTFSGYVDYDGGKFLVASGRILREVNGLVQDPNNADDWYYVAEGQVATTYTGLVLHSDGKHWFYVENGKLNVGYTGPVEYAGQTFEVVNGALPIAE